MEVIPHTQLRDKHRLLPLFLHAGLGSFDYRRFERRARADFRRREGPGGFCAVEREKLVGFVGVMEIPTRTVNGSQMVGGICDVATDPTHVRRGVATALMEAAHRYFREKGMPFAFLTANRSSGAYVLYRRLGYAEVEAVSRYPTAYTLVEPVQEPVPPGQVAHPPTEEGVARLFPEFTAGLTGFVIRPKEFLGLEIERKQVDPNLSVEMEGGYALVSGRPRSVEVREIVTKNREAQGLLLRALDRKATGTIVDPAVTTAGLSEGYEAHGYHVYRGRYFVVMAKALEPDISVEEAYGGNFYMSALEWF